MSGAAKASWPDLPIVDVLDELRAALASHNRAIVIAPPGAGKTTLVPLALRDADWLAADQKIIMLEPRRLAARAAAHRMAALAETKAGDLVGYRMRMDTKVSRNTRIEVVTEGVFTRLILDDPELTGVGCVIFDEFHERSLDADFGLALALEAQTAFRHDLKLIIMSATLDGARVKTLLGEGTPVLESKGRTYPVDIRYKPRGPDERVEAAVEKAVLQSLRDEDGSILAFLPGRAEIERVAIRLRERVGEDVFIALLFGAMDVKDQARAIEPSPSGKRKVVLATSVAQTSITIDGVRVVIDSGLSREAVYEPKFQTTRLETVRVSQATADQRAGRAGRTARGVALRLWHEGQTSSLRAFDPPQIEKTDLSRCLLDAAMWGVGELSELPFLDAPPAAAVDQAKGDLVAIGALDASGKLTEKGRQIASIPLPVPLAAMLVCAETFIEARARAELALAIVDVAPTVREIDLETVLRDLRDGRFGKRGTPLTERARRLAAGLGLERNDTPVPSIGRMLLDAYPSRLAKRRSNQSATFLMANGRGVVLDESHPLAKDEYLVIADVSGKAAHGRIVLAAAVTRDEVEKAYENRVSIRYRLQPTQGGTVSAREERHIGAVVLSSQRTKLQAGDALETALCELVVEEGLEYLPWTEDLRHLRDRLDWLHSTSGAPWPAFDDDALCSEVDDWLKPYLAGKTSLAALTPKDMEAALLSRLPWELQIKVDELAPGSLALPTNRRAKLHYRPHDPHPRLSVRVQELYGLALHPTINAGLTPVLMELLSPAQRPIQTTLDLPGFWQGSWEDIRKQMRGRYPKHLWPDDPANAQPTMRAKPRK